MKRKRIDPTRRLAWRAAALCLVVLGAGGALAADEVKARVPITDFALRLKLSAPAKLSAADVRFALLPGGKHCAVTYEGVRSAKGIARYTKLGFRTSVSVGPEYSAERLKALEDAGADLIMGGRVGYTGWMGGFTPQQAYDYAAMRRLNVLKKCRSPMGVGSLFNMKCQFSHPYYRKLPLKIGGNGYALLDSNWYGNNIWAAGHAILLGRDRPVKQIVREKRRNKTPGAPDTLVYYQTVGNILRGIVEMVDPGKITTVTLCGLEKTDPALVERFLAKYGRDGRIWHAGQNEIFGYEYLKAKSRVVAVKPAGNREIQITFALEKDTFCPFLMAPLCLRLPGDFPVASARLNATDCPVTVRDKGVFVDVPVQVAVADGCRMSLKTEPNMTIPDEMPVTLTVRNTSQAAVEDARLEWVGSIGTEVTGGTDQAFTLAAGASRQIAAKVRTLRGPRFGENPRGARFGICPVHAILTGRSGGEDRKYMAGFQVVVAPRLRVEADPFRAPVPKGRKQRFYVHLANGKVDKDRAWGEYPEKLIHHKTGPCKGTVSFKLPDGLEAVPPSQPFQLGQDGHQSLAFWVRNHKWVPGEALAYQYHDTGYALVAPEIRFEGEAEPIEVPWYGTAVTRDPQMQYEPLNDAGLLAYASWDDPNNGGDFDLAVGSTKHFGRQGGSYHPDPDGVKGWCIGWRSTVFLDGFRNLDHERGTALFWLKRDPKVRNEIRWNGDPKTSWKLARRGGEHILTLGRRMQLRRYPKKRRQEGFLELVYREMFVRGRGARLHYIQVPYETSKLYQWRHVAVLWDMPARRLELYLDGKLAGKAGPGDGSEWVSIAWDRGGPTTGYVIIEDHHGRWTGSMRDELFAYNRPLSPREIAENMQGVRAGKVAELIRVTNRAAGSRK